MQKNQLFLYKQEKNILIHAKTHTTKQITEQSTYKDINNYIETITKTDDKKYILLYDYETHNIPFLSKGINNYLTARIGNADIIDIKRLQSSILTEKSMIYPSKLYEDIQEFQELYLTYDLKKFYYEYGPMNRLIHNITIDTESVRGMGFITKHTNADALPVRRLPLPTTIDINFLKHCGAFIPEKKQRHKFYNYTDLINYIFDNHPFTEFGYVDINFELKNPLLKETLQLPKNHNIHMPIRMNTTELALINNDIIPETAKIKDSVIFSLTADKHPALEDYINKVLNISNKKPKKYPYQEISHELIELCILVGDPRYKHTYNPVLRDYIISGLQLMEVAYKDTTKKYPITYHNENKEILEMFSIFDPTVERTNKKIIYPQN